MPSIAGIATRYRWELLLFIGIPIIVSAVSLLFMWRSLVFGVDLFDPLSLPFRWLTPILLGVFYVRVRSLGRPILKLVWGYAFVAATVGRAVDLSLDIADPSGWWMWGVDWRTGVQILVSMIVLVWFAGRASKVSFSHALLLIGLTTALVVPDTPPIPDLVLLAEGAAEDWSTSWTPYWWVHWPIYLLRVSHSLLAIWAVAHVDSIDRVPKKAVLALFGLAAVLHIASQLATVYLVFDVGRYVTYDLLFRITYFYWAAWYAAVILLTHRYDFIATKLVDARTYARRLWEGDLA